MLMGLELLACARRRRRAHTVRRYEPKWTERSETALRMRERALRGPDTGLRWPTLTTIVANQDICVAATLADGARSSNTQCGARCLSSSHHPSLAPACDFISGAGSRHLRLSLRVSTLVWMTRLQHGLRILLAVLTLGCAAVTLVAEPVAAAPSALVAAACTGSCEQRVAPRAVRSGVRTPRPQLMAAACRRAAASRQQPVVQRAPGLARAPRLYLRHCVLIR